MKNNWVGTKVKLEEIEGIGPAFGQRLREAGIKSIHALLMKGMDPKGRKGIAASVRTTPKMVLEWVNRADLFRVKGVGEQYSDLLEKAGVDTVVELGKRKPASLCAALAKANEKVHLVNKLPTVGQVEAWVKEAKKLPRVVKY